MYRPQEAILKAIKRLLNYLVESIEGHFLIQNNMTFLQNKAELH